MASSTSSAGTAQQATGGIDATRATGDYAAAAAAGAVVAAGAAGAETSSDTGEDDDSTAPFPPYRERDDDESLDQREDHDAHSDYGHEPFDGPPSHGPPPAADSPRPRLFSDADTPPSPSPPAAAEPELSIPPSPPSPPSPVSSPVAPPPPYWTHSHAGSHNNDSSNTRKNGLGAGRPAAAATTTAPQRGAPGKPASFFHTPFRRNDRPHEDPPVRRLPTGDPNNHTRSSANSGGSYHAHRRDTSSSTLDLNVNLITLQDNEASDNDDDGRRQPGAWQHNGASAGTSPTTLRSPGPPPGSSGSNNSSSSKSKNNRCWARRVDITDYVVVNGGGGGGLGGLSSSTAHPRLGAFVVWTVRVQTLAGGGGGGGGGGGSSASSSVAGSAFCIYKRYSEFDTLRRRLVASFPQARGGGALPPLPPKSLLGKFRPAFLEQRRLGLQYFLNCILLNPEFSGSPVLQEFLFA